MDVDAVETLSTNLFYRALRRIHRRLWLQAAKDNMSVCIPQSCSLTSTVVTRHDAETHILIPDRTNNGVYTTLNNKKLLLVGSELVCQDGFKQKIRVKVLSTEEIAARTVDDSASIASSRGSCTSLDSRFSTTQNVQLIFINRPLEGGIDAPGSPDDMSKPTVRRFIGMLRCYPENQAAFQQLSKFVAQVHTVARNGELGAVKHGLQAVVKSQVDAATAMIFTSSVFERRGLSVADRTLQRTHLKQVLESYVMDEICEPVFRWVDAVHCRETRLLHGQLSSMAAMTQEDMGIKPDFRTNYSAAIKLLSRLGTYKTPLEKLQCLRDVTDAVQTAVEDHLIATGVEVGSVDLSTDDMLDIILFVIVQALPESEFLLVHLKYIKKFHFVNSNTTILGYTRANFDVAVKWLLCKAYEQQGMTFYIDDDDNVVPQEVAGSSASGSGGRYSGHGRGASHAGAAAGEEDADEDVLPTLVGGDDMSVASGAGAGAGAGAGTTQTRRSSSSGSGMSFSSIGSSASATAGTPLHSSTGSGSGSGSSGYGSNGQYRSRSSSGSASRAGDGSGRPPAVPGRSSSNGRGAAGAAGAKSRSSAAGAAAATTAARARAASPTAGTGSGGEELAAHEQAAAASGATTERRRSKHRTSGDTGSSAVSLQAVA